MTLAFTPTSATSLLKLEINGHQAHTAPAWQSLSLFQDDITNAIASTMVFNSIATGVANQFFNHVMVAGTTDEIVFKVRGGGHVAGSCIWNGNTTISPLQGGVMASSIIITEYAQ